MSSTDVTSQLLTTVSPASHPWPTFWGFLAIAVASILFGSNLIPVKKFETGDGLFFQWVCCTAIWMTALVLNWIRQFPQFHPLAMLGGFLRSTGNVMVVPILKTVGLSQGMLIWGSINMLSGWAVSRFGFLGLNKEVPPQETFNYVGVVLCLVSAVTYMFLKTSNDPSPSSPTNVNNANATDELLFVTDALLGSPTVSTPAGAAADAVTRTSVHAGHPTVFYDRMSPVARRVLGTVMAVTAGLLFGLNFTPVIYIQQHREQYHPTASRNSMDYVFAHFTGFFVSSTVYLLIYSAAMKNKPRVYPEIPALIGAFWGIVLFHEIKGRRNYIILTLAVCFAVTGSVLTGLSKWDKWKDTGNDNTTTAMTTATAVVTTSNN